ncbi:hypothetical protein RCL1_000276 [Eukaryota sp. TZLM3-RCL]
MFSKSNASITSPVVVISDDLGSVAASSETSLSDVEYPPITIPPPLIVPLNPKSPRSPSHLSHFSPKSARILPTQDTPNNSKIAALNKLEESKRLPVFFSFTFLSLLFALLLTLPFVCNIFSASYVQNVVIPILCYFSLSIVLKSYFSDSSSLICESSFLFYLEDILILILPTTLFYSSFSLVFIFISKEFTLLDNHLSVFAVFISISSFLTLFDKGDIRDWSKVRKILLSFFICLFVWIVVFVAIPVSYPIITDLFFLITLFVSLFVSQSFLTLEILPYLSQFSFKNQFHRSFLFAFATIAVGILVYLFAAFSTVVLCNLIVPKEFEDSFSEHVLNFLFWMTVSVLCVKFYWNIFLNNRQVSFDFVQILKNFLQFLAIMCISSIFWFTLFLFLKKIPTVITSIDLLTVLAFNLVVGVRLVFFKKD